MPLREPPFEGSNDAGRVITGTSNPTYSVPTNVSDQQLYLEKNTNNGTNILWLNNSGSYETVATAVKPAAVFDGYIESNAINGLTIKGVTPNTFYTKIDKGCYTKVYNFSSIGARVGSLNRTISCYGAPNISKQTYGSFYVDTTGNTIRAYYADILVSLTNGSAAFSIVSGISNYTDLPVSLRTGGTGSSIQIGIDDTATEKYQNTYLTIISPLTTGTPITGSAFSAWTGTTGYYNARIGTPFVFTPDMVGTPLSISSVNRTITSIVDKNNAIVSGGSNSPTRLGTSGFYVHTNTPANTNIYASAGTFVSGDVDKVIVITGANGYSNVNSGDNVLSSLYSGNKMTFRIVSVSADGSYATLDKKLQNCGTFTADIYNNTRIGSNYISFSSTGSLNSNGLLTYTGTLPYNSAGFTKSDVGATVLINSLYKNVVSVVSATQLYLDYTGVTLSSQNPIIYTPQGGLAGSAAFNSISINSYSGSSANQGYEFFGKLSWVFNYPVFKPAVGGGTAYVGLGMVSTTDATTTGLPTGYFGILDKNSSKIKIISGGTFASPTVLVTGTVNWTLGNQLSMFYRDGLITLKMISSAGATLETLTYSPTSTPSFIPALLAVADNPRLSSTASLAPASVGSSVTFTGMASTGGYVAGDYAYFVPTNAPKGYYMKGMITSVTTNTSITILVQETSGTGTFSGWSLANDLLDISYKIWYADNVEFYS